jgi:hypothetical protein
VVAGSPRHVVHFYRSDNELAAAAGCYLAEALRTGGAAVVVAEKTHQGQVVDALAARGIDVAAARRAGALLERAADDTLYRLEGLAGPDPAAFETEMGGLLRAAGAGGGPVRVFGEMVALPWRRGLTERALALERLWNELGRRQPFSLFCAYPEPAAAEDSAAMCDVAELHGAVHGSDVPAAFRDLPSPPSMTSFFDFGTGSLRPARSMVSDVLTDWGVADLVDDAAIVVSELAGNAVLHARSGFDVTVSRTANGIRVGVGDLSGVLPQRRAPNPEDRSGRGLLLIDRLASRWGVTLTGSGKTVWADLSHAPEDDDRLA